MISTRDSLIVSAESSQPNTGFVACIEGGVLEAQALLLFESIRQYAGRFRNYPIYALSPRPGHAISESARSRLDKLRVTYIDAILNTECREYGFSSIAFGLRLWLAYYQRILSAVRPEDRVVTHYEAYFYAPKAELRRVVELLNIHASKRFIDEASPTASANLRHQIVPIEVLSSEVAPDILKCYLDLCEQAGPIYQASLEKSGRDPVLWQLDEKDMIIFVRRPNSLSCLKYSSRAFRSIAIQRSPCG